MATKETGGFAEAFREELGLVPSAQIQITERQTLDILKESLRAHAWVLTEADALTLADAEMAITDKEDYARGFQLLDGLRSIGDAVETHYKTFKGPLSELTAVVRELEKPQLDQVKQLKERLGARLVAWKQAEEKRQAEARRVAQEDADRAAAAAAQAAAAELETMAALAPDAALAEAMRVEAEMTRITPIAAAPVAVDLSPTPKVDGHTRKVWKARIDDIDALIRAHVNGQCHLPVEDIAKALGPWLDRQATQHEAHLPRVYPGVSVYTDETAVAPRRRSK